MHSLPRAHAGSGCPTSGHATPSRPALTRPRAAQVRPPHSRVVAITSLIAAAVAAAVAVAVEVAVAAACRPIASEACAVRDGYRRCLRTRLPLDGLSHNGGRYGHARNARSRHRTARRHRRCDWPRTRLVYAYRCPYGVGTRSMLGCAASNVKNVEHNLPLILHGWSCGILYGMSGLRPVKLGSKSGYEKL